MCESSHKNILLLFFIYKQCFSDKKRMKKEKQKEKGISYSDYNLCTG